MRMCSISAEGWPCLAAIAACSTSMRVLQQLGSASRLLLLLLLAVC